MILEPVADFTVAAAYDINFATDFTVQVRRLLRCAAQSVRSRHLPLARQACSLQNAFARSRVLLRGSCEPGTQIATLRQALKNR